MFYYHCSMKIIRMTYQYVIMLNSIQSHIVGAVWDFLVSLRGKRINYHESISEERGRKKCCHIKERQHAANKQRDDRRFL